MSSATDHICVGVDVGTGSIKTVAIDARGSVVASATVEHSFETPKPGWAQCDPELWWSGACRSLQTLTSDPRIKGRPIAALGLSGQMHGLVLVDSSHSPTTPALMWNDQRTEEQCSKTRRELGDARILELTGNRLLSGMTAPKFTWLREHQPEAIARAAHLMLPKDFVRLKLTGSAHTDVSDASGTLFFDCHARQWSGEMCRALSIPTGLLPQVFESPLITSRVSKEGSAVTGLPEGTPVVAGAGDQAAQAVGTGIVSEGQVSCTIGTSGVIFASTDSWRAAPGGVLHAFCHAIPDRWHLMGVMQSAGGSLRWFRDALCQDLIARAKAESRDPYELIEEEAQRVHPGSDGLSFLPYLSGERCPHSDPNARGAFAGLSVGSTRAQMARALFEGVACSISQVLDLTRNCGTRVDGVRLSGGGARSPLMRRLLTDLFGVPTACVEEVDGAAVGAALLAGVGAGIWPSVDAACAGIRESTLTKPEPVAPAVALARTRNAALYRALAPWFAASGTATTGS